MFSTHTSDVEEKWPRTGFDAAGDSESVGGDGGDSGGDDATLEDAARHEHEYLRQRLRDELGREPTEDELNEWLREHTEGY
jgi:hypothetical protein